MIFRLSGNQILDTLLDAFRIGPDNRRHFVARPEKVDGRKRPNPELFGNIGDLVEIELVVLDLGIGGAEIIEIVRKGPGRTAPGDLAVQDNEIL